MNPKYFTGKPCSKCGQTARYISSPGSCVTCNKARSLAKNQAEYASDPEKQRKRSTAWRERNRDKERARYQRWAANNRAKRLESRRADRERRERAEGCISQAEIDQIFREQEGKCAFFQLCGSRIDQGFRCDHIVPIIAGGPHYAWNRQLLCEPCNLKKKGADPLKFAAAHGLDPARALRAISKLGQFLRP